MNKRILFTILLFIFISNLNAQAPKNGLILYYPFNNNVLDESGKDYNGISHGTKSVEDRFYINERALYFDGISEYIELPNKSELQPDFPFAISFWVLFNEYPEVPKYFFRSDDYDKAYSGFWVGLTTLGQVSTGYGNGDGTGSEHRFSKYANSILDLSVWHNIIISFNSPEDIDIFINCRMEEGTRSGTASSMKYLGYSGSIGRNFERYFNGKIDDLRIYNRSLIYKEVPYLCYENPYYIDSIIVTDTLIIDVTFTGINEQKEINTIKIYPNPVKNVLYINSGDNYSDISNYSIKIFNTVGQTLFNSLLNSQLLTVNIDEFKKTGLYYVQIIDDKNKVVDIRKIILK